ncbi:MAG: YggT family protein [Clostridiales bacterium]|jgi:YggT family protein|nr:YggT family protein [Clostridiales bacterium]
MNAIAVVTAINWFTRVIEVLIFVNVILSWIPPLRASVFGRIIYSLTEPLLSPIRYLLSRSPISRSMPLDFSPIIALFLLQILSTAIISIILGL